MLRIPEDHEHSDVSLCLREAFSVRRLRPSKVGKAVPPAMPALLSFVGHPGLRDVRS